MWWNKKGKNEDNEKTKVVRRELATKVIELDNQTRHLEELMKAMLEERAKNGQPK